MPRERRRHCTREITSLESASVNPGLEMMPVLVDHSTTRAVLASQITGGSDPAKKREANDYSLILRPEYLALCDRQENIPENHNILNGVVDEVVFLGEMTDYTVRISDSISLKTVTYGLTQPYSEGQNILVHWDKKHGILL